MRRLLLILLAIFIVLAVLAFVVLPLLIDKDKVLELAANTVKEQTGATLEVAGDASLSLFPTLAVSLGDAAITLPEKSEPDVRIGLLEIGLQLFPLLTGEVQISTFNLVGLQARIEMAEEEDRVDTSTMSDAELNAFYAQRRKEKKEAGEAAGAEAALAVPLALNVQRLTISDAKVELVDPNGAPSTHLELVALKASGLNLDGRQIPLEVELRLPGEQTIDIALVAKLSIDQDSQMANLADIKLSVRGATPEPLKVGGTAAVDMSRQIADLDITLELDAMRGTGTVRYASYESPQIDSKLHLNLLDPALLILAGPEAAEAAPDAAATTGDEPLPLDAIRTIDTRAVLTIDQARFDAHAINDLTVNLRVMNGIVRLNKLVGELHGGKLNARATFNGKHNIATLDTTGNLRALDIASAVAATGSAAALSGKADLQWELKSKGSTANQLTGAMTGPIKLDTRNMVLAGTSVEKLLCQAVALTNQKALSKPFSTDTKIETLGASIQLRDGKAVLQPLEAKLPQVGLSGGGDFDLLSGDFDMVFKASLSKDLEKLDPACSVSNRLTSIDWPVACKGNTADEPASWCGVDASNIIKDLTVNEGKKKVKKEAGKLLNKFLKR